MAHSSPPLIFPKNLIGHMASQTVGITCLCLYVQDRLSARIFFNDHLCKLHCYASRQQETLWVSHWIIHLIHSLLIIHLIHSPWINHTHLSLVATRTQTSHHALFLSSRGVRFMSPCPWDFFFQLIKISTKTFVESTIFTFFWELLCSINVTID